MVDAGGSAGLLIEEKATDYTGVNWGKPPACVIVEDRLYLSPAAH
ncbi:MAG: hypothetical protein QOG43_2009 [Actinomycetota bacterium]|jgi:hypothetical protein|nr:hypothetical protein [Actinomycetota bacterium]